MNNRSSSVCAPCCPSRARSLNALGCFLLLVTPLLHAFDAPPEPGTTISRIAFGSCNTPLTATPIWESVLKVSPDLWIWLGDTVYADWPRPSGATPELRAQEVHERQVKHYAAQNAQPLYQQLRLQTRVIGTWDDHDFGINDMGADFVGLERSQENFLDFYGEPPDSPRRTRPGVYASYRFGPPGRTVQIIMLDTRSFRSPLKRGDFPAIDWAEGRPGTYVPVDDPAATILGADQWRWLESVLRQPADVRIIGTSIQAIADDHRFEKWGNFPHERRRLFQLIRKTEAKGVLLISGDRHTGELSRLDPTREREGAEIDPGYPLYELTSSAMTRSRPTNFVAQSEGRPVAFRNELNRHRVGSSLAYNHFALLTIDWEKAGGAEIVLGFHLDHGEEVARHRINLSDLQPPAQRP